MVAFTQYMRPRGKRESVVIDLPEAIEDTAALIIKAGLRFECEVLTDGTCSFTITGFHPDVGEEQDIAIKLCSNGPVVPQAVIALIQEFDVETYKTKMKALDLEADAKEYHKDNPEG